jgi:polyisoprenoid-binding protein YceI
VTDAQPSSHPSAPAPDGEYAVDLAQSEVRFKAKAFGLVWVRGRMPAAAGSFSITGGTLSGTGEIAADKVDTGVGARDAHLRSSHYLATLRHPTISATVDGADLASGVADSTVVVRGTASPVQMTIASVTVGNGQLRLEASVALDRTPYPMFPPAAGVSRIVHVELTVVAQAV